MAASAYQVLINKLNEFIRKYYANRLLKGLIYTVGLITLFFICITYIEYFAWLSSSIRSTLFYSFIVASGIILINYIVIPFLKIYKLGSVLSYEDAAAVIGQHFSSIQDKLLNILQLHHQYETPQGQQTSNFHIGLLEASINQKIKEIKPIPFTAAIDFNANIKHLKLALIPLFLLIITLFSAPHIIREGTERIVGHSKEFEKPAPFQFVILNDELSTVAQKDYLLDVKLTGDELPENIYISINGSEFKLTKENIIHFHYTFKNVQQSIPFHFVADGFHSKTYELEALPNPTLLNFQIELTYPKYLHKNVEIIKNSGDIEIPAGTLVKWIFNTENTSQLNFSIDDSSFVIDPSENNKFNYKERLLKSKFYSIATSNEHFNNKDAVKYRIDVVPDKYPEIEIEERKDSVLSSAMYFRGEIKDDYGFSKLTFNYRFINKNNEVVSEKFVKMTTNSSSIKIDKSATMNQFYYLWNLQELGISPGDNIEYYFEVWDNDDVVGHKSTRSQKKTYKIPSLEELEKQTEKTTEEIKDELLESIKSAKNIQKEIADLQRKISEKKNLSWEEKKKLENLLNKQKELQKKIENTQKLNQQNNKKENEFRQQDENLLEKKKQLEELFEKVLTPELKQKIDELNKLLEQLDKSKIQDALEKMKFENKDLIKELDRNLEVFKQLEVEQKIQETIEKLDRLSEKQEKLAEQTEQKQANAEQLKKEQENLKKEFEEIQKDLQELDKKNKELEQPKDIENTEKQEQDIKNDLQKSSENLNENNKKGAAQNQKNAAQKMKKMAEQLSQMQQEMESQEQSEDIDKLRSILDNLIHLSFEEEKLMNQLSKTPTNDPQFFKINQQQKKLHDDAKMIEDSLFALSKRVPQIESFINREISAINMNMGKAEEHLSEASSVAFQGVNHKQEALSRQQFSMTSINNLALMLSEILSQMQAQAKASKPGSGSCKKPGGNGDPKPSAATLKKMQQQLNEQIKKLKEGMEKNGGNSPGGMSKELAKLAAQQEAIRKELKALSDQLNKDGKGSGNGLNKLAEKMEETEKDLVNKIINQETINRQEEILTRLLESEKAEREREQDEKRQSKEGNNDNFSNPEEIFEYKGKKEGEEEMLRTLPPSFNSFFKGKAIEYFKALED